MKKFKLFTQYFVTITTGILIIVAASYAINGSGNLPGNLLLHILLCGLITAADTTLLFPGENASKKRAIIGIILHFVSLCVIIAFFGTRFGWFSRDAAGVMQAIISVFLVYVFTFGTNYLIDSQQAKQLNEALEKKYSQEDP